MESQKLEEIVFGIISQSGDSFSRSMLAMDLATNLDFLKAETEISLAEDTLMSAHKIHSRLLADFAQGNKIEPNILLVHAQDHLSKAEIMIIVAKENIKLKKSLNSFGVKI